MEIQNLYVPLNSSAWKKTYRHWSLSALAERLRRTNIVWEHSLVVSNKLQGCLHSGRWTEFLFFFYRRRKCHVSQWWLHIEIVFSRWKLAFSSSVIVLPVYVIASVERNRRHYFRKFNRISLVIHFILEGTFQPKRKVSFFLFIYWINWIDAFWH